MIDLTAIPEELRLARGGYSTVRAAHEDSLKELARLCGELQSIASQILRRIQPDSDTEMEPVDAALATARGLLDAIEERAAFSASLGKQRAELKKLAWGR